MSMWALACMRQRHQQRQHLLAADGGGDATSLPGTSPQVLVALQHAALQQQARFTDGESAALVAWSATQLHEASLQGLVKGMLQAALAAPPPPQNLAQPSSAACPPDGDSRPGGDARAARQGGVRPLTLPQLSTLAFAAARFR